jgi:hypothetical protein
MTDHIDENLLRVAEIRTMAEGKVLTNASGCFYLHNNYLFVVTARHVVCNEPTNHRPEELQIVLHNTAEDLTQVTEIQIPLYRENAPCWLEHPTYGAKADVAAVPIEDPNILSNFMIATFSENEVLPDNQPLPVGQDVLIVGYPLGFHDSVHHLPLVRSAMIASVYGVPFKNDPYFLTDARLHRGTSGAPVIAYLPQPTEVLGESRLHWYLLGIHSASLDVSNRDPQLDEPLGLNCAWYAALIPQILAQVNPAGK